MPEAAGSYRRGDAVAVYDEEVIFHGDQILT
jgi:hypothetical protein